MDTTMRCAGVAYFGFLSLFPAATAGIVLIGLLAPVNFVADVIDRTDGIIPEMARRVIADQIATLLAQPRAGLGIGLAISVIIAVWSGSRGVAALIYATSRTRAEPERRSVFAAIAISICVTAVAGLSLLVILALVAGLPAYFSVLPWVGGNQDLVLTLRWPVLLAFAVLAIAAFYRFAPDRKFKRAKWIWPGAFLASVLWLAACAIFSFYVEYVGNLEATFGSLTTAIVLLLWMYNSAQVVVLGATFNAQLERDSRQRAEARAALSGPAG